MLLKIAQSSILEFSLVLFPGHGAFAK